MLIVFRKLTDRSHVLDVRGEAITCETRSYLRHDLLHYAVETEAGLEDGFWGNVARGRRMSELGGAGQGAPELLAIERLVGALDGAAKGQAADDVVAAIRRYDETSSIVTPAWLTEELVVRVQERMRRLMGHWNATPYGGAMELTWPARAT